MDSPNAKSTRSLTRVLNIRRRRSVDPLLPHPRCRESALIPANALLSLSLFPHSTMRRHHGWNYVGAQREGTWRKTRSKYVPASPPLDPEDLLARFLRVPAIHADEKSANLESFSILDALFARFVTRSNYTLALPFHLPSYADSLKAYPLRPIWIERCIHMSRIPRGTRKIVSFLHQRRSLFSVFPSISSSPSFFFFRVVLSSRSQFHIFTFRNLLDREKESSRLIPFKPSKGSILSFLYFCFYG